MRAGLSATLERTGEEWTATMYARPGKPFAMVVGSWRWVRRGLVAAGLAAPLGRLAKHGDIRGGRRTLVGSKPPHRNAQRAR